MGTVWSVYDGISFSEENLVVQRDGDQGDSLHRTFVYALGKAKRPVLPAVVYSKLYLKNATQYLQVEPGVWTRGCDKNWVSNPKNVSRDQLIPVLCWSAVDPQAKFVRDTVAAIVKRGFFAQNTLRGGDGKTKKKVPDSFLFSLFVLVRAYLPLVENKLVRTLLRASLFVLDLQLLLAVLFKVLPFRWNDSTYKFERADQDKVDDWNDVLVHDQAYNVSPTPISTLARKLYSKYRPENYGNTKLGEINRVMGALVWYNRAEKNGNPSLAEIWRDRVLFLFGG